jgi:hypothetical protein
MCAARGHGRRRPPHPVYSDYGGLYEEDLVLACSGGARPTLTGPRLHARRTSGSCVHQKTKCRALDTRNVALANDAERRRPYARPMDHGERSQVMKRTAIALGIVSALLVAPSVASAANVSQVRSEVVRSHVFRSQIVDSQVYRQQVVRQIVRPGVVRPQLRSQRASALNVSQNRLRLR